MESRHMPHGRHLLRHALHMMLGCCFGVLLLLVAAPFIGGWAGPLAAIAFVACALLLFLHHRHGMGRVGRWLPWRRRGAGES